MAPVTLSYGSHHGTLLLAPQQQSVRSTTGGLLVSPALHQSKAAGGGHVIVTAAADSRSNSVSDCGAVNLSIVKRADGDRESPEEKVNPAAGGSSSQSLESGRSARSCKGKRYQEFIEDGRINAPGSRKRRSHRSGEESEEEAAVNLSLGGIEDNHVSQQHQQYHRSNSSAALNLATTNSSSQPHHEDQLAQNHWKKKLRTAASFSGSRTANGGGPNSDEPHHRGVGKRGQHSFHPTRSVSSFPGNNTAFDGRYRHSILFNLYLKNIPNQGYGSGLTEYGSGSSIFAQSGSSSGSGSKLKQNLRRQFLSQFFLKSKFESNKKYWCYRYSS
jgi:hypothetical protein